MRIRFFVGGLLATFALLCLPALASAQGFHSKTLHIKVHIGPGNKTTCNLIGEIFRPDSASAKHPDPAILTTNGFGGSYNDQVALAKVAATRGYVVLAYSGLGFGGSSCRITLDSTTWDGAAARQLVTFLGGGSSAVGGYKVNYVAKQKLAPNGKKYKYDPRVGMIGGSYGGAVQLAAAAADPRIDTIIPMITWNNLAYSLAPNNTSLASSTVNYTTPGITKLGWLNLFWFSGVSTKPVAPFGGASTCPNFSQVECAAHDNLTTDGYPDSATLSTVKQTSVANFMKKIKIPTMLMQGEDDTLFTLHEAVATYNGLRKQHTPVKMVWQSWGHSDGTPQPGEWSANALNSNGTLTLEGRMVMGWFNHYLKHTGPKPTLNFSFYRPWVKYKGTDAAASYASASKYPIGTSTPMYLSGTDALVSSSSAATAGTATFETPGASDPESVTDDPGFAQPSPSDPAGTYAEYESAPLTKAVDVVGVPTVKLSVTETEVDMPTALRFPKTSVADTLGLFFRVEDISANGSTVTLPDGLISAARFAAEGGPVTVALPGIVHQFAEGDRIALVVAGSDSNYFLPNPDIGVTVSSAGGVLNLPEVTSKSYGPVKLSQ